MCIRDRWRAEELADTIRHYNPQPQEQHHQGESVVRSNLTKEQYSQMVQDAKEYLRNGDIFQIVLSQRFEISNPPDSFSVYRKLRATNPSPYLYYFHTPEYDVAGASPEMLAKVTNGKIQNRPIAGTKPRGRTPEEDLANEKAYVQAGAGIVADSVPENEYYETVNKALAVINAIKEAE